MITLTESAISQLQSLLEGNDKGDGLRLFVEKGGCAGMQYGMKVDSRGDGDEVIEKGGVRVYVDPESLSFISECELDYSDSLNDSGFKINNPLAQRSCGCGTSFEPAEGAKTEHMPASTAPPTACEDEN
ncbi:MAG: iron-sulfur cluster assembly accessory protein [Verrucomicrobiota bacterium]